MRSIQGTWKIVVFQVGEHVGLWHIIFFLCDMKVLQEDWKIEFYVIDIFLKFTSIVRQLLSLRWNFELMFKLGVELCVDKQAFDCWLVECVKWFRLCFIEAH